MFPQKLREKKNTKQEGHDFGRLCQAGLELAWGLFGSWSLAVDTIGTNKPLMAIIYRSRAVFFYSKALFCFSICCSRAIFRCFMCCTRALFYYSSAIFHRLRAATCWQSILRIRLDSCVQSINRLNVIALRVETYLYCICIGLVQSSLYRFCRVGTDFRGWGPKQRLL